MCVCKRERQRERVGERLRERGCPVLNDYVMETISKVREGEKMTNPGN